MAEIANLVIRVDSREAANASRDLDRLGESSGAAEKGADRLTAGFGALRTAILSLGIAGVVKQAVSLADTYNNLTGRLRLVTNGTAELAQVQSELFQMAQRTRSGFAETGDLYARIARSAKDLGLQQSQLLSITETINQAMVVSGSSAEGMRAALVQLGQGFASGTLRGEELNSVLEQAPRLAQAIADGMGVSVGQLRKLGEDGKLTAEAVTGALLSQRQAVEREFAQMPKTVGQALTVAGNELLKFVGLGDQATGASSMLASGIIAVSKNFDVLAAAASGLIAIKATTWIADVTKSLAAKASAAMDASNAVAVSNAAMVAQARAEYAVAQAHAVSMSAASAAAAAEVRLTEAQVAQGTVSNGFLVSARTKAAAALAAEKTAADAAAAANTRLAATQAAVSTGASFAARALGLLGGPIGAVSLALGAGITAWQLWSSAGRKSSEETVAVVRKETGQIVAEIDEQIKKLKERNALVSSGAIELAKGNEDAAKKILELKSQMADVAAGRGQYGALPEIAKSDLLQKLGLQIAALANKTREYGQAQEEAGAKTKAALDAKWLKEYATDAEKANARVAEIKAEYLKIGATMPAELEARVRASFNKGAAEAIKDGMQAQITEIESGYEFQRQLTQIHIDGLARQRESGAISEIEYIQQVADAEVYQLQLSKRAIADKIAEYEKQKNSQSEIAKLEAESLKISLQIAKTETKAGNDINKVYDSRKKAISEVIALQKQDDLDALARSITEAGNRTNAAIVAVNEYKRSVSETVELAELEMSLLGRSEQERRTILEQHRIEVALRQRILQIQNMGLSADEQDARIQDLRLAAMKEQAVVPARIAAEEWQKTSDQIGQSLYDAIIGQGVNAWEALKRAIESMVIKPILMPIINGISGAMGGVIQGVVQPVAGAVTSAVGSGLASSVVSGAANSAIGGVGAASLMGQYAATGLMNTVAGTGTMAGLNAAGALISGGSTGAGIAMGIGAAAPWIAAIAAIVSLFSRGGETRYGGQYGMRDGSAYLIEGPSGGDPNAEATMRAIEDAQGTINRLVSGLGGSDAGQITRAGYELSKYDYRRFSEIFVNGQGGRQYGIESNEAVGTAFAEDLQRGVLMGLQAAQLPEIYAEYLAKYNAFELTGQELSGVLDTMFAMKSLGETMSRLGGVFQQFNAISIDSRLRIIDLTGGLDAFNQKVGDYVSNFYTDQEQAALKALQIQQTLTAANVNGDWLSSREQFRWLTDSLNISQAGGEEQFAAMMNVASEFASISDYLSQNNLTIGELAATVPETTKWAAELTSANEIYARQQQESASALSDAVTDFSSGVGDFTSAASEIVAAARSIRQAVQEIVSAPRDYGTEVSG